MAFTTIPTADIATGKPLKQTLFQYIKDDIDWLKSQVDNIAAGSGLVNGSFEFDSDSDGIPDGWARTLGAGASSAIETTAPIHGSKAFKFTTPGSVNNYLETTDYIRCSPNRGVAVGFIMKVSTASAAAAVLIRWYDKAQSYLSTTIIFAEYTSNPTSYTRYVRAAVPPTSAVFYKLRVYGGTGGGTDHPTSDATSGDIYFDGVTAFECDGGLAYSHSATIAEGSTNITSYADKNSCTVPLPSNLSSTSFVRLIFPSDLRSDGVTSCLQRFRVGGSYSVHPTASDHSRNATNSGSYVGTWQYLDIYGGSGGSVTLYQQLASADDGYWSYGKKDTGIISVQVLAW